MKPDEPLTAAEVETLVRLAAMIVQEADERRTDEGSVNAALASFSDPDTVRDLALRAWRMNEAGLLVSRGSPALGVIPEQGDAKLFAACLTDRTRDCKLNVECVGVSVDACLAYLREAHGNPSLSAKVLPGEERDGWFYVEIPGSHLYFQVFEVGVASRTS